MKFSFVALAAGLGATAGPVVGAADPPFKASNTRGGGYKQGHSSTHTPPQPLFANNKNFQVWHGDGASLLRGGIGASGNNNTRDFLSSTTGRVDQRELVDFAIPFTQCNSDVGLIEGFRALLEDDIAQEVLDLVDLGCGNAITNFIRAFDEFIELLTLTVLKAVGVDSIQDVPVLREIFQFFIDPIRDLFADASEAFGDEIPLLPGFCVGDFNDDEVWQNNIDPDGERDYSYPTDYTCGTIPFKSGSTYSVFAARFPLTMGLAQSQCKIMTTDPVALEFCVAYTRCGEALFLPSYAVAVNNNLITCLANNILDPALYLHRIITEFVQSFVGDFGFGLSFQNAFEIDIPMYAGTNDIYRFGVPTTQYFAADLVLGMTSVRLPDFLSVTGQVQRGLGFQVKDTAFSGRIEDKASALFEADKVVNGLASVTDLGLNIAEELIELFTVNMVTRGQVDLNFDAGAIAKLSFLPEITIQALECSMYLSTAREQIVAKDGTIVPVGRGFFMFTGTDFLSDGANAIFNYVIELAGPLLMLGDFLTDVCPVCPFTVDDLVQAGVDGAEELFKDPNNKFGVGMTVNDRQTGFMFNLPMAVAALGRLSVNCYAKYNIDITTNLFDPQADISFQCDVIAEVDGLLELVQTIVAIAEDIGEGIMWIISKLEDPAQTVGVVVGYAYQEAVGFAESVFSQDNLIRTAQLIEDHVLDNLINLGNDALDLAAEMLDTLDYASSLGDILADGVQEVASIGDTVVTTAQNALDEAENFFEGLVDDIGDFFTSCNFDAIADAFTSGSSSCEALNTVVNLLVEFSSDVLKVAQNIMDDILDGLADFFTDTEVKYKAIAGVYSPYECPLFRICVETTIAIGPLNTGIEVREECRNGPHPDCVYQRAQEVERARQAHRAVRWRQTILAVETESNRDALFARSITRQDLIRDGDLQCNETWSEPYNAAEGDYHADVVVSCTAHQITKEGTWSTEFITVESTLETFDRSLGTANATADIKQEVADRLTLLISSTMSTFPGGLINKAVYEERCFANRPLSFAPKDSVDYDCDGYVDNQQCDYDWQDNNQTDCRFFPPALQAIANMSVTCGADASTFALGRPVYEVDEDLQALADAGEIRWVGIADVEYNATEAAALGRDLQCGDRLLERSHQLVDPAFQRSNVEKHLVEIEYREPDVDFALLNQAPVYECEVTTRVNGVDVGLNAPAEKFPDDWVGFSCREFTQGYYDAPIDYVGCPDNPAGVKAKGWNVARTWFVNDGCTNKATDINIVRTDERDPRWTSTPLVRVQTCLASFFPNNTGYPVAQDNCDPVNVLNPVWKADGTIDGGRMAYVDTGDTMGCKQSFEREFTVNDRVCNSIKAKHTIESCNFAFMPEGASPTVYDAGSRLPTFVYTNTNTATPQRYVQDVIHYIDDSLYVQDVSHCKTGVWEYLNGTATGASWTALQSADYGGVANLDNQEAFFSLGINQNRQAFQTAITNYGGTFRISVECRGRGGTYDRQTLTGCAHFKMNIV